MKEIVMAGIVLAMLCGDASAEERSVPMTSDAMYPPKSGGMTVNQLPDAGEVTIVGTVQTVLQGNDRFFILKDAKNSMIDVESGVDVAVAKGDKVIVTGEVQPVPGKVTKKIAATAVIVIPKEE